MTAGDAILKAIIKLRVKKKLGIKLPAKAIFVKKSTLFWPALTAIRYTLSSRQSFLFYHWTYLAKSKILLNVTPKNIEYAWRLSALVNYNPLPALKPAMSVNGATTAQPTTLPNWIPFLKICHYNQAKLADSGFSKTDCLIVYVIFSKDIIQT